MNELMNLIKDIDNEKKKKLFSELCNVKTVENIIDIGNNYNLKISKDLAQNIYDELNKVDDLSKKELSQLSGGGDMALCLFCSNW